MSFQQESPQSTTLDLDGKKLTISLAQAEHMQVDLLDFIRRAKSGEVKTKLPPGRAEKLPLPDSAVIDEFGVIRAGGWVLEAWGDELAWFSTHGRADGSPAYRYAAFLQRKDNQWKITDIEMLVFRPTRRR